MPLKSSRFRVKLSSWILFKTKIYLALQKMLFVCFTPAFTKGWLASFRSDEFGCPTVISNVSSLPEVGGDAAIYFDPLSVDDIAQKIEKVISDEKLRGE